MPSCLFQLAENRVTRISVSQRRVRLFFLPLVMKSRTSGWRRQKKEKRSLEFSTYWSTNRREERLDRPGDTGHVAA